MVIDLGQHFENNFDCYTESDIEGINNEMAMTKDKFIEVVTNILDECGMAEQTSETPEALPLKRISQQSELLADYDKFRQQNAWKYSIEQQLRDAFYQPIVANEVYKTRTRKQKNLNEIKLKLWNLKTPTLNK